MGPGPGGPRRAVATGVQRPRPFLTRPGPWWVTRIGGRRGPRIKNPGIMRHAAGWAGGPPRGGRDGPTAIAAARGTTRPFFETGLKVSKGGNSTQTQIETTSIYRSPARFPLPSPPRSRSRRPAALERGPSRPATQPMETNRAVGSAKKNKARGTPVTGGAGLQPARRRRNTAREHVGQTGLETGGRPSAISLDGRAGRLPVSGSSSRAGGAATSRNPEPRLPPPGPGAPGPTTTIDPGTFRRGRPSARAGREKKKKAAAV